MKSFIFIFGIFLMGSIWPTFTVLSAWLIGLYLLTAIFRKRSLLAIGYIAQKNRFIVFLSMNLLLLLLVQTFLFPWWYFGFSVILLAMIHFNVKWGYVLINSAIVSMHLFWFFPDFAWVGTATLGLLIGFSLLLTETSRKVSSDLEKKISVYERESKKYLDAPPVSSIEEKRAYQTADRLKNEKKQFQNILEFANKIFEPHTIALYLFEPCEDIFILQSYMSQSVDFKTNRTLENQGVFLLLKKQKKPIQVHRNAIRDVPYYTQKQSIQTVLLCPLIEQDQLVGVLVLDHASQKTYLQNQIDIIEHVVGYILSIMKDSKTIVQFEHLKQEFESFYQASSALNRAFRMQEVLDTLLHMGKQIAPYDWGAIVLYHEQINKNIISQDSNQDCHKVVGKSFSLNYQKSLVSWVIDQKKPLLYNHFLTKSKQSPLFSKSIGIPNYYESALLLPLYVNDQKIGAFILLSKKNFFFTRIIQNMLEVLGLQASIAIQNAMSVQNLEKLATTDGLTGLMNHRSFQETFKHELERSKRYQESTTLLLIDLDFFKKINDEYGHPVGDEVLRQVSSFLLQFVRNTDFVARYGGEEFAIILPNTTASSAKNLANRMVKKVNETQWKVNRIKLPITFSIGIASSPEHGQDQAVLIEHADQALYYAKDQGRNRACLFHKHLQINLDENEKISQIEREVAF